MQRNTVDSQPAAEVSRQQIVALLVSGLRRYIRQSKLKRLNPEDSLAQRLEFSHDPRLSVSQHVGTPDVSKSQRG